MMKIDTRIVRDVCFAAAVTLGAWIGGLTACMHYEKNMCIRSLIRK